MSNDNSSLKVSFSDLNADRANLVARSSSIRTGNERSSWRVPHAIMQLYIYIYICLPISSWCACTAPIQSDGRCSRPMSNNALIRLFCFLQVKFYPRGDESNVSNKLTAERHVVFTGLRPRTDYGFQVRAKTARGWGEYSPTIYKTTGQLLGSGKNTQQQVQRKTGSKDDTGKMIIELISLRTTDSRPFLFFALGPRIC